MKRFVIYISLLLILTSFHQNPKKPKSIAKAKSKQTIALIHHNHLYFIRVKLNGKKANLLVDTGAAVSLLDINQAEHYKFRYNITDEKWAGVGGLSNRYRVFNYQFDIDTTQSLKVYPFGADLKTVSTSFSESGISIAGILGSDFLQRNDAVIDYKNKTLLIHH